jgi:trans-aconitate 2-methyltransferase
MKWDAELYDSTHGPQCDAGLELIRMASVRASDDVLDVGCGTGTLTRELARRASGGMMMGIDPSREMFNLARKSTISCANIVFMNIAAEEMDFREKFDLVFSNSAFQWIKDQEGVVGKAFRALRAGGRLAIQMPAGDFCRALTDTTNSAISMLGLERNFRNMESPWRFPLKGEMAGFMDNAGFRKVEVFYRDYTVAFKNINDVLAWAASAGLRPYLARLSGKSQERLKYAFAMGFESYRTDKGIEFGFRRLFALGEK